MPVLAFDAVLAQVRLPWYHSCAYYVHKPAYPLFRWTVAIAADKDRHSTANA